MRIESNKLQDIIEFAHSELQVFYTKEEIRELIFSLITSFCGISRTNILAYPKTSVSESELLKINFAIKDLKANKPLQYIIKEVEFCNITLKLNYKTLIPRPETEELTSLIIEDLSQSPTLSNLKIADLGCGSGAIALTIKKNISNAEVWAFDIDQEAVNQTKENAKHLDLDINIVRTDILQEGFSSEKFDIIISNPPYIMDKEKIFIKKNVLNYEPHRALFVPDNNPLIFYSSIYKFCLSNLNPNGRIYLEINENLGKEVLHLFNSYKPILIKDLNDKPRFIKSLGIN